MKWAVARGHKPISSGGLAALALGGLTLLLAGCATTYRGVCRNGICVEWNDQPDQSFTKLDAFMVSCTRTLNRGIHGPVQIIFVPTSAEPFDGAHAGAWFDPSDDTIYVKYIDDLWRSEICHELLHRELWLLTGDPDRNHSGPGWNDFCGGGYLVCR